MEAQIKQNALVVVRCGPGKKRLARTWKGGYAIKAT